MNGGVSSVNGDPVNGDLLSQHIWTHSSTALSGPKCSESHFFDPGSDFRAPEVTFWDPKVLIRKLPKVY